MYTNKIGRIICSGSLRPCLGQGVSLGGEAVLADSGREGEIVAWAGRVRPVAILSILQNIFLLPNTYWLACRPL